MRVTSLLQDMTGHQSPVTEGVVYWSTTAPALTRRLLPAVRGYWAGLVRRLYCAARWQGGRLLRHRVVRGYPKFSGRLGDAGTTWVRRDVDATLLAILDLTIIGPISCLWDP
ncbi:hypothetical protein B296_00018593 [Ensete ventricosum]|uniref:Uncharacterized protein n=1 Tax=Ensete ventricosum TaxID=4639 RepID=A0A427AJI4_ENSVE|nr:hypothetical protein B296_00018593 [Ensete ventricosum]